MMKVCSKGRGGIENFRNGHPDTRYAVDVAEPGRTSYPPATDGLIFRFFTNWEDAQLFADHHNVVGNHAIIVPAWFADKDHLPRPWDTTEGRAQMEAAYRAAGVPLPEWIRA